MSHVQSITENSFDSEVMQSVTPVVVDFYATWCPPCRALAPVLDKASEVHGDTLKIFKVNVEENPSLASRFRVTGVPTIVFFSEGHEEDRIVGMPGERILMSQLETFASSHAG